MTLFRAWNRKENKWDNQMVCVTFYSPDIFARVEGCNDDIEITQWTGFHDKNGVKIFDNDVIQWGIHVGKVFMQNGTWCFGDGMGLTPPCSHAVVIGNIYEATFKFSQLTNFNF